MSAIIRKPFQKGPATSKKGMTIEGLFSSQNQGLSNKVMVYTHGTTKLSRGDETETGNANKKVAKLDWSFNPGDCITCIDMEPVPAGQRTRRTLENAIGGDAANITFSFCSNSSGADPIPFFVVGGHNAGIGSIEFPYPLESPHAETHISVHAKGVNGASS